MAQHALLAGLEYVPDYLDQEAHDSLLAAADEHPWQTSVDHRVQVYGYHYSKRERAAFRIGELPAWAMPLAMRLHQDRFTTDVPNQLVVNDYQPGAGIFDHMDQAVFGDVVISVSLGSHCVMRFTRSESEASPTDLLLEPRSALVLAGEARWHWRHGIPGRLSDRWEGRDHAISPRVAHVQIRIRTGVRRTRTCH